MFETIKEFMDASRAFVSAFNAWCSTAKPTARADHICYKCGSASEFESLRALLEPNSQFIYQSIVAGRRIAIVKFAPPLSTALGEIPLLELSDQKPDGSQTSGFDHIEIYPTNGTLEELAENLTRAGIPFKKIERPHHTTFDAKIFDSFLVRLEQEPLLEKIMREEMLPPSPVVPIQKA